MKELLQNLNCNMENPKILFLVITSKTHNHNDAVVIDRVDLTRKMDILNTWGQDVIDYGHEIVFIQGSSDSVFYDEKTKTLHLDVSDDYESGGKPSPLFDKVQKSLKWVVENVYFDILYLCDDDVYVNLPNFLQTDFSYDFMSHGALGGGGFVLSKKSIDTILKAKLNTHQNCDTAIFDLIRTKSQENNLRIHTNNNNNYPFYVPGELFSTVHYVTGKRMYHLNYLTKFYQENGYTNRKIILGGPLDSTKRNDFVTYESSRNETTPRWYDFVVDKNGWEYHGGYIRSNLLFQNLRNFWPYGVKSTKFFVLNFQSILSDYLNTPSFQTNLNFIIKKCEESLINKKNLFLISHTPVQLEGWKIDDSIKESHKLNYELLNTCFFYRKIDE